MLQLVSKENIQVNTIVIFTLYSLIIIVYFFFILTTLFRTSTKISSGILFHIPKRDLI